MDLMMSEKAPCLGAASDGDGDRNMIVGRGIYVTPSDSLAVLAAKRPYGSGLSAWACRCGTLHADQCCLRPRGGQAGHSNVLKTPTGWKFFGNLLDADMATICGEEKRRHRL